MLSPKVTFVCSGPWVESTRSTYRRSRPISATRPTEMVAPKRTLNSVRYNAPKDVQMDCQCSDPWVSTVADQTANGAAEQLLQMSQ